MLVFLEVQLRAEDLFEALLELLDRNEEEGVLAEEALQFADEFGLEQGPGWESGPTFSGADVAAVVLGEEVERVPVHV